MSMENKICSECGTENENGYVYCKNCGAPLISSASRKSDSGNAEDSRQTSAQSSYAQHFAGGEKSDGADAEDFRSAAGGFYASDSTQSRSSNTGGSAASDRAAGSFNAGAPDSSYGTQYNAAQGPYGAYAIGGIPADEVAVFVGKKASEIMPKFIKSELSGSRTSWCWPTAILGFFFGPMGAALWFLYRKMYKIGALLLVIGAALTFFTAALSFNPSAADSQSILDAIIEGDSDRLLNELWNNAPETVFTCIANLIDGAASLAVCILTGLFGFNAYKEHCVQSIRNFRSTGIDPRYYRIGLASLGGVSGGMIAVGIISIIVVGNVASVITALMSYI